MNKERSLTIYLGDEKDREFEGVFVWNIVGDGKLIQFDLIEGDELVTWVYTIGTNFNFEIKESSI
jgi:hypothetical protein